MVKALERLLLLLRGILRPVHALPRRHLGWLYKIVHRIENGKGRPEDLDMLNGVHQQHHGPHHLRARRCRLLPVQSFTKHFGSEFEYHIEHKKCLVPVDVQRAGSGFFTAKA